MSVTKEDEDKWRESIKLWTKEAKKFFKGKKWNKKQRKELEKQGSPPLKINRIDLSKEEIEILKKEVAEALSISKKDMGEPNTKSGAEMQREAYKGKTIEEIFKENKWIK